MVEIIVDKDLKSIMEIDDRRLDRDGTFSVTTRDESGKEITGNYEFRKSPLGIYKIE